MLVMEHLRGIGSRLSDEFFEYDTSALCLRRKLKNFRDQLNRIKLGKRSGADGTKLNYKWYEYIKFMEPTIIDRSTTSNFDTSESIRSVAKSSSKKLEDELLDLIKAPPSSNKLFLLSMEEGLNKFNYTTQLLFKSNVYKYFCELSMNELQTNEPIQNNNETALDILTSIIE
ncbi:uncharacterized protein LOC135922403 [Gordionus sp. m RMFG-2023]|uniref:uncharacterized protein LOC135922403 n=1 Tax=Gordionus sp. m RMFG-2023 TaxID=3053472 RepID=UPI0031FC181A